MATPTLLLPGEHVSPDQLPKSKTGTLTLGPGLRLLPPHTIQSTTAGALSVDHRKGALWLEHDGGRYQPAVGDLVIAQIHHSTMDAYACALVPHTPYALLGQLAFEAANKKTRPQLKQADLVYARVVKTGKNEDTEIECFNSSTGKAEGMGPLKNGMLFSVSPSFARRLMMGTDKAGQSKGAVVVLEEVGEKLRFEVAVGRNGKVWVDAGSVREILAVGRLVVGADEGGWSVEEQKKQVKKAVKEIAG